jgi:glycosyltransferase involved in cell wall biosynthesis
MSILGCLLLLVLICYTSGEKTWKITDDFVASINLNTLFHFEVLTAILGVAIGPDLPNHVDSSPTWPFVGIKNILLPQKYLQGERRKLILTSPSFKNANITFINSDPNDPTHSADVTIMITAYTATGQMPKGTRKYVLDKRWYPPNSFQSVVFLVHNIPKIRTPFRYGGYDLWYLSPHAARFNASFLIPSFSPALPPSIANLATLNAKQDPKRIVFMIQGTVQADRRDYAALFEALEDIKRNRPDVSSAIAVYVIGRTTFSGKQLLQQLKDAAKEDLIYHIKTVESDNMYLSLMRKSDVILPLAHRHIPGHRPYFETKLTSSISLALALGVPVIAQYEFFAFYPNLQGVPYDSPVDGLKDAIIAFVEGCFVEGKYCIKKSG